MKKTLSERISRIMQIYESKIAVEDEPEKVRLRDDHGTLTSVYRMRKSGLSEMQVAARVSNKLGRRIHVDGLFHNADHEVNMSRADYHGPNTWHPSLSPEDAAHVYKLRAQGHTDHEIKQVLSHKKGKVVSHSTIRYNADHPQATKIASSPAFHSDHGVGYVEPNAGQIGKKPKYIFTPQHTEQIKSFLQHSPKASAYGIIQHLGLPLSARDALKRHLRAENIKVTKRRINSKHSRFSQGVSTLYMD